MNHQGLRWSVHCVANVGPGKRLNLYKRGFKIYDLLVFIFFSDLQMYQYYIQVGSILVSKLHNYYSTGN